jgi:hypothetical protein
MSRHGCKQSSIFSFKDERYFFLTDVTLPGLDSVDTMEMVGHLGFQFSIVPILSFLREYDCHNAGYTISYKNMLLLFNGHLSRPLPSMLGQSARLKKQIDCPQAGTTQIGIRISLQIQSHILGSGSGGSFSSFGNKQAVSKSRDPFPLSYKKNSILIILNNLC